MDSKLFRNACGAFATGVTIITTEVEGEVFGMTANGFMSVSLDPQLIVVSIGNHQNMAARIKASGKYVVNVLTESQLGLSNHFAGKKDENLAIEFISLGGQTAIGACLVSFATEVVSSHEEGDHTLFVGRVTEFVCQDETSAPLLFYKGKYETIEACKQH